MKTFTETLKDILAYIGITLLFLCSCIHDVGATAFTEDAVDAKTSGIFTGTAEGMDEVGVYSDYVIFYPDSGEVDMDGKSIYRFKGMTIRCDLGVISSDGKSMYLTVNLGDDMILTYPARMECNHGTVYFIFDEDEIRSIECDITEKLGFPLD